MKVMKKKLVKKCLNCKKKFFVYPYEVDKRKYCSKHCSYGSPFFIETMRNTMMGRKHSEKSKKKMSETKTMLYAKGIISPWNKGKKYYAIIGDKNKNWKGDEVGYDALHDWVNRHLGKPDTCEFCKKSGLKGKFIQWANKSHKYKRDLSDWIRLCAKCHFVYDKRKLTRWK